MNVPRNLSDIMVRTKADGNCQNWTGTIGGKGHGYIYFEGKSHVAHRLVWELARGPIPKGKMVCRTCNNFTCINVAHLFIGTMREVRALATQKGRCYRGGATLTHCKQGHQWREDDWIEHKSGRTKGLRNRCCKACARGKQEANPYPTCGEE